MIFLATVTLSTKALKKGRTKSAQANDWDDLVTVINALKTAVNELKTDVDSHTHTGPNHTHTGAEGAGTLTLVNQLKKSLLYCVFGNPGFVIDTNFDVKNGTAVYYANGGTLKTLSANANFDTGTAATFPTAKWAAARDRKSTRLNSSHIQKSRMPSSA